MNHSFSRLSRLASVLFALSCVSASAQTTTPSTTLCASITTTNQNTICLTLIANVVRQTRLVVDNELLVVASTPVSASAVSVIRDVVSVGPAALHANGAQVWIGYTPVYTTAPGSNGIETSAQFQPLAGACTRSAQAYLPIIAVNLARKFDCDVNTGVWRDWQLAGPAISVTDTGANNAIASAIGTAPAYTGMLVQVTLAHSLQAGANTFAYNGGSALAIKSSRNPANSIGTAYVSTGVVTLELAYISGTGTWLDISQ